MARFYFLEFIRVVLAMFELIYILFWFIFGQFSVARKQLLMGELTMTPCVKDLDLDQCGEWADFLI